MITPLDILSIESWILIVSVIVLVRYYIHRRWQVLKSLNIPHDPPSILNLGTIGYMLKDTDIMFTIDSMQKKKYGLVYGSYLWLEPRICIHDPDVLKQVFIKQAGAFRDRQKALSKLNGKEMNTAMTVATAGQWKRIRNTVTPTFSTSKLKDMFVIVDQCTDKTVENLRKELKEKNGRFNAKDIFGKLSMDVICWSAFGVDVNSQEGNHSELVEQSKKLFTQKFFGLFVFSFLLFPWTEKIAEILNYSKYDEKLIDYYKLLIDTVIKKKKAAGGNAGKDILQGMLSAEITEEDVKNGAVKGITRTEIVGNLLVMLMGGYETTSCTMIFFAYCIATEPQVQEKMLQEVIDTKEKYGSLTYEAINSMKYLDMCFKESQRLYGTVPRNARYTEVEVIVKGITIPAGTQVDVPVYALHHDEEYWQDPWKFIPERFEDMSKIDPMVYQPFGAGPRNCIGMRLAILEVKMAIAKLLLNFQLDVCDDTPKPPLKVTFRSAMQPKEEVNLKVSPRVLAGQETEQRE